MGGWSKQSLTPRWGKRFEFDLKKKDETILIVSSFKINTFTKTNVKLWNRY